ncbi:hypothetical protein Ddc_16295 [Ditylenchus destructor]|nr:hypothetical protein Ddc_16295 [Ditylenchus destructor]
MEPKAKTSQSDDEIPNIATIDNGTMMEAFKFLNYYQLATNSFVSKRFWNLIRNDRHNLALLNVDKIFMNSYVSILNQEHADINLFNEKLSPEEYNEWIVRNGYSKQVPLEGQMAGKESTKNDRVIYLFYANIYQDSNHCQDIARTVLYADVELKDETWPLFQHFIRLLMDPFIYIRTLWLSPQKDVFSLLVGAMNPDRDRLQCKHLNIRFNGETQKFTGWTKNHVRCEEYEIYAIKISNCDEELFDLFLTGAQCAPAIDVKYYDLSKVIVNLVQKFMSLKNGDEYQVIESIRSNPADRAIMEAVKRNCAEFIAEEKDQYEEGSGTTQIISFINNDIEKKLALSIGNFSRGVWLFSVKITNL